MVSYSWTITPVGVLQMPVADTNLSNVFTALACTLVGTDGTHTVQSDAQTVPLGAPDPNAFIAAADVTAANLLAWLIGGLSADAISALKQSTQDTIAALAAAEALQASRFQGATVSIASD